MSDAHLVAGISTCSFFKGMFENAREVATIDLDVKGTILAANQGFEKMFGYTSGEVACRSFVILFTLDDRQRNLLEIDFMNVLHKGASNDNNYAVRKDGSAIWVNGESTCVRGDDGTIYIVKSIRDIHQQKLLEQFLQASNELNLNVPKHH